MLFGAASPLKNKFLSISIEPWHVGTIGCLDAGMLLSADRHQLPSNPCITLGPWNPSLGYPLGQILKIGLDHLHEGFQIDSLFRIKGCNDRQKVDIERNFIYHHLVGPQ